MPHFVFTLVRSQLQEQALLVLEENEVLLKKFDVQEEKISQIHEQHHYECKLLYNSGCDWDAQKYVFSN